MSTKQIIVCDGCGCELRSVSDIYKLRLETDSFWDGVETVSCEECLDFCKACAREIKTTLQKIAASL